VLPRVSHHPTQEGKLRLRPNKTQALIDFVSSVPQILSQAATPPNIKHGFVENGMADGKKKAFPDYNALAARIQELQSMH
jgi:hypothetical protein